MDKAKLQELSRPFPKVDWKPQSVSKGKALLVAYVDARAVLDRLDEVVGPDGWHDSYEVLADHHGEDGNRLVEVKCRLTILGVTKEDVGEGDSLKAAFSDALKRAAVKFGVGRYLYSLPRVTVPYEDGRIPPETFRELEEAYQRWIAGEDFSLRLGNGQRAKPSHEGSRAEARGDKRGITEAQKKAIINLARKVGISQDELDEYLGAVLGREVSLEELSLQDASQVIRALQEETQ